MIAICTGEQFARIYDRTMVGFGDSLIELKGLEIRTLIIDNGGENNLLWQVIDKSKLFNCRSCCSGLEGTLENSHRLIRRIIPKGKSLDSYTNEDLEEIILFCNNYHSKRFKRV